MDGGGGTSTAGTLALTGTIGQADAGPLSGGSYTLNGGFWTAGPAVAVDVEEPGAAAAPRAFELSRGAPNPFRTGTRLQFSLPRAEHARVRVYDITGRHVATLVDEPLDAGAHTARWDGRNRAGRRVAAGVYFVRMQAGTFGAVRKITRLE
ncbi:MAG: T9SS type A sorting domain-containing protein [Gemmatimonadetes bacterium]|nr:T9SS type A sorting domain-containing protein [Gemmatimonadota bacterium]